MIVVVHITVVIYIEIFEEFIMNNDSFILEENKHSFIIMLVMLMSLESKTLMLPKEVDGSDDASWITSNYIEKIVRIIAK